MITSIGHDHEAILGRGTLAICDENQATAGDRFFPNEALAWASHGAGDAEGAASARDEAARQLAQVEDEGLRSHCSAELEKLDAALAGGARG